MTTESDKPTPTQQFAASASDRQEERLAYAMSQLNDDQRRKHMIWVQNLGAPKTLTERFVSAIRTLFNRPDTVLEDMRRRAAIRVANADAYNHNQSMIDPLTGIGNGRFFKDELNRAISSVNRQDADGQAKLRYMVVLFDMNGLKPINDGYGHQMGDKAIKCFADHLRSKIRSNERCARLNEGGDEFGLIISDTADNPKFISGARRHFRKAFEGLTFNCSNRQIPLTASFGVVEIKPGMTEEEIMKRADFKAGVMKNYLKKHGLAIGREDKLVPDVPEPHA